MSDRQSNESDAFFLSRSRGENVGAAHVLYQPRFLLSLSFSLLLHHATEQQMDGLLA
jgi:hypothetical protein